MATNQEDKSLVLGLIIEYARKVDARCDATAPATDALERLYNAAEQAASVVDGTPRSFYGYLLGQVACNPGLVVTRFENVADANSFKMPDVDVAQTAQRMAAVAEALAKHCRERSKKR